MRAAPPIVFGTQVCGQLPAAAQREWLVADGAGGYAMGTVAGLRTRRYHGLLVVAGARPASRHLALASLDPVLRLASGAAVRLGTHEWAGGAVDPAGYRYLSRFDLTDALPRWRWRVGDVVLERELAMVAGRPALAVVHRLIAGGPVRLALEALCTWRDAHGERYASGPPLRVTAVAGGAAGAGGAGGAIVEDAYRLSGPGWEPGGQWYHGAYARAEADRGLNPTEDLWYAGRFTADLHCPGDAMEVCAWAGDLSTPPQPATEVIAAARRRAAAVVTAAKPADATDAALALAADAFVVRTPAGPDVVAGYPWFGAWSRDTMISYEGLFLGTGRTGEGRELLRTYAATLSEGMLANTADTGQTEYNTADATLWFMHAVDRHLAVTGDTDLAGELMPALDAVVTAHVGGTRFGLRACPDGLLRQGAEGQALTWMDARVDGVAVTPRAGKAVEINALWINGLAAVAGCRVRLRRDATEVRRLHARARRAFAERFAPVDGWPPDVTDLPNGAGPDRSRRPNHLLALSLPHPAVDRADPRPVRAAGAALLTPLGLRTLAPGAPGYRSVHRGGPVERDRAYHQGTVWPWLIGPYVDACLAVGLPVDGLLDGLAAHLPEWGLGSVSETADADPPHPATGCPFQAWSVAEFARVRRRLQSGSRSPAGGPARS
jgi:predicted glycogen debranching enzyme